MINTRTYLGKCLFPGCWHEMISGEYEEQAHAVYTDMMTWMKERWA